MVIKTCSRTKIKIYKKSIALKMKLQLLPCDACYKLVDKEGISQVLSHRTTDKRKFIIPKGKWC